MIMERQEWNWVGKADLSLQNSFGTLAKQRGVELEFSLGIHEGGATGWFELYDTDTGGERWYAEGGLWFDGLKLVDYDGVFALPHQILNKLNELGYNTEEI